MERKAMREIKVKVTAKGDDRRTKLSGKAVRSPRRLSDLVREETKSPDKGVATHPSSPGRLSDLLRKNGRADSLVQEGDGSKGSPLKRAWFPSKEASTEHAVIEKRGRSKHLGRKDRDAPEKVFHSAVDTMKGILKAVRTHSSLPISTAEKAVELLLQTLEADDALLVPVFSARGHSLDPPMEAVNVSILAVKFGMELAYTTEELRQLSLAALLHDVGMTRLPVGLVEKQGRLNPVERSSLAQHPEEGAQTIRGLGPEYTWLAEVIMQVHERVDGSGYPQALKGPEVHEYAQIIGLADVYESLVHHRPYRRRLSPIEALKEILHRERTAFPDRILKALIQALSPYPVGSMVCLNTGEIGRVVRKNKDYPLRPVVEVLGRGAKRLEEPVVIDLGQSPLVNIQESLAEEPLP